MDFNQHLIWGTKLTKARRFERAFSFAVNASPALSTLAGLGFISGFIWAQIAAIVFIAGLLISMFAVARRRRIIAEVIQEMDDRVLVKKVLEE